MAEPFQTDLASLRKLREAQRDAADLRGALEQTGQSFKAAFQEAARGLDGVKLRLEAVAEGSGELGTQLEKLRAGLEINPQGWQVLQGTIQLLPGAFDELKNKAGDFFQELTPTLNEAGVRVDAFWRDLGNPLKIGTMVKGFRDALGESTLGGLFLDSLSQGVGQLRKDLPTLAGFLKEEMAGAFSSLGGALASPFGAAFILTAGLMITSYFSEKMVKETERYLAFVTETENRAKKIREEIQAVRSDKDIAAVDERLKKEIEILKKEKEKIEKEEKTYVTTEMMPDMGGGFRTATEALTSEGQKKVDVLDAKIASQERALKDFQAGGLNDIVAKNRAEDEAKARAAVQKETAHWNAEHGAMARAVAEQANIELLTLEDQLKVYKEKLQTAQQEYDLKYEQADGPEAETLSYKFTLTKRDLTQEILAKERAIGEEKERNAQKEKLAADEAQRKAERDAAMAKKAREDTLRNSLEDGERAMRASLDGVSLKQAKLQADFRQTEAEKRPQLLVLLREERAIYEAQVEALREKMKLTASPEERELIQQRLDGLNQSLNQSGVNLATTEGAPDPNSVGQNFTANIKSLKDSWGTTAQQIAQGFTNTINTAIEGTSQAITGLIMGTTTWGQALQQVGNTILTSIVESFVQMGVRWVATKIFMATVGKALDAAGVAATAPLAAAYSGIWAGPAALATIASYGGASAAAPGLIAGAIGLTKAISIFGGQYQRGGFTGAGNPSEPAGIVHRGEFVVPAEAVNRIGLGALNDLAFGEVAPGSVNFERPAGGLGGGTTVEGHRMSVAILDSRNHLREFLATAEGKAMVVDIARQNRVEIGVGT